MSRSTTMKALPGFWALSRFIYGIIKIGDFQKIHKSSSWTAESGTHGTYSPPTGRAMTPAGSESCRFGLFGMLTRPSRCINSSHCMYTTKTFNQRACGEKYSVHFEPINSTEQPGNTSSRVSSILSKTYTAPFKNLYSHNYLTKSVPVLSGSTCAPMRHQAPCKHQT